jgi:hypothetical protein
MPVGATGSDVPPARCTCRALHDEAAVLLRMSARPPLRLESLLAWADRRATPKALARRTRRGSTGRSLTTSMRRSLRCVKPSQRKQRTETFGELPTWYIVSC